MTPRTDNTGSSPDRALIVLFAETTDGMITLRRMLDSNPAVANATRGCDVRKYRHPMTDEDHVFRFETYVEAETRDGEIFCWWLDITWGSSGWELQRDVSKQTKDGEDTVIEFEDRKFENFDKLSAAYAALLAEFVKSAENFDFSV